MFDVTLHLRTLIWKADGVGLINLRCATWEMLQLTPVARVMLSKVPSTHVKPSTP